MNARRQRARRQEMEKEAERNAAFYGETEGDDFWEKVDQEWAERKDREEAQ